jgi:DNA-binding NarL/FixJ family response regulator
MFEADSHSRQHDVLTALRTGMSNRQIACDLRVSESTIKIHMTAIFKLLGVRNRTEAVIVTASTWGRQ